MTGFSFGQIVLLLFPFTDQATSKKRPAVVVSSANYHQMRPDLIVMAVTSRIQNYPLVDIGIQDWQSAGLLKPSVIKPVIATIDRTLVLKDPLKNVTVS